MKILDVDSLLGTIPLVTDGIFGVYKEMCLVTFSSQGHKSGGHDLKELKKRLSIQVPITLS